MSKQALTNEKMQSHLAPLTIEWQELETNAHAHNGIAILEKNLKSIADEKTLLAVLGQYIFFNAHFGGGVANLASEIASRPDLFRDPGEPVEILADRSHEIGAAIFAAAVDEFDIWSRPYRGTHRSLAMATLKSAATFFRHENDLNNILQIDEHLKNAADKVRDGYALNQKADELKLFHSLGFHLGSEILADQEFRVIDNFFRTHHPHLVAYMRQTPLPAGTTPDGTYTWIAIHTKVEIEHFEFGLKAANDALLYYAGEHDLATAKEWILEGFHEFAALQAKFIKYLFDTSQAI